MREVRVGGFGLRARERLGGGGGEGGGGGGGGGGGRTGGGGEPTCVTKKRVDRMRNWVGTVDWGRIWIEINRELHWIQPQELAP